MNDQSCGQQNRERLQERHTSGPKLHLNVLDLRSIVDENPERDRNDREPSAEHGKANVISRGRQVGSTAQAFSICAQFCTPSVSHVESYSAMDRARVIQCLNYYVKFCGPNYIWRKEVITTGTVQAFAKDFFQMSVAEPVFLESILAICQADFDLRSQTSCQPSRATLQHRSKALRLLRQKLSSKIALDDGVALATVVAMLVYEMATEDWTSYAIHLKYLRLAMRSHTDAEALRWQGWFAYSYSWAELRWATHEARETKENRAEMGINSELYCKTIPIPVDNNLYFSELPEGFQKIAMSGLLGPEVRQFLGEMTNWTKHCQALGPSSSGIGELNLRGFRLAEKCVSIISIRSLRQAERLICIAATAYILSLLEGPAGHSRGLEDLTASLDLYSIEVLDADCRLWVAMSVATANDTFPVRLPNRWILLDQVLELENTRRQWSHVVPVFRLFCWYECHANRWRQCWDTALQRRFIRS
ncbi:hypothetical protein LTR84_008282 [Exophiala bonariae]|uniref:Transcription factor domain-containing protein n=1 Tax=Exophiala bonariae TaxID=1690606 RepID=A0AAV9MXQ4_9EURO|nr:hypothetical protein LTR84_008282 [Exophiala bonariae]